MRKFLLLLSVCCFLACTVRAQSTCTQTLRTARATYDQGRLHELPSILEGCIRNGFTEQEKVEAYKLLTLTYIYLEEPTKADEAMLNLLRTDHYFEINPSVDPAEFIALYKTFRTKPVYKIGGKIGANASSPNVEEAVEANSGTSKYGYKIGVQFHVDVELPIKGNWVLNPELGIAQRTFSYTNKVNFTDTAFTTKASEKQTWVSLPISIQYQIPNLKFHPFVAIGVEGDYLLNAAFTGSRTRKGYQFIEEKSFDLKPQRQKFNLGLLASAGAHFKLGGGFLIAEVRFLYGLKAVNSKSSAFNTDSNLAFQYGYADSIFKINSLSVTAGYVYNIFNPKKLNKRK